MQNSYPVPLILTCTVTGKTVKYYSRPYIENRIAKAGDLATLINTFMAKGAKKNKPTNTPTTKTWKGQEIIKSTDNSTDQVSEPSGVNNNVGEKVYKYADGGMCRVTYS